MLAPACRSVCASNCWADESTRKKKWRRTECRLAKFYGFNVFSLPNTDKLALEVNMEPLRAEGILRERYHSLSADDVKRLTLIVTGGDEEQAEEAWTTRAEEIDTERMERDSPTE